jgi:7-cyano-7-deazaguanine synthase
MSVLVLLSGGLDSFILSSLAKENGQDIYGLTFDYKQVNRKEIQAAENIGKYFDFKDHIFLNIDFGKCGDKYLKTSLITNSTGEGSSYVPARNLIFLSYAVGIAESMDIDSIAIGITAADYSITTLNREGYPDCSPDFLASFQKMVSILTNKKIRIYAPLINMTKDNMIKYGASKRLDFGITWSCYKNGELSCGECLACKNRIAGFYKANIEDRLQYKKNFNDLALSIKSEWGL